MKKNLFFTFLGGAALALMMTTAVAGAASSKSAKAYVGVNSLGPVEILGNKVSNGLTVGKNDFKMVTVDKGQSTVKEALLQAGASQVDLYQLMVKQGNSVKYAALANIGLGLNGAHNLLGTSSRDTKVLTATIAGAINSDNQYGYNSLMPYRVIQPLQAVGKTYQGIVQSTSQQDGVSYRENVHVLVYDDKYMGPTVRAIALSADDEQSLWPSLAPLMKIK